MYVLEIQAVQRRKVCNKSRKVSSSHVAHVLMHD